MACERSSEVADSLLIGFHGLLVILAGNFHVAALDVIAGICHATLAAGGFTLDGRLQVLGMCPRCHTRQQQRAGEGNLKGRDLWAETDHKE